MGLVRSRPARSILAFQAMWLAYLVFPLWDVFAGTGGLGRALGLTGALAVALLFIAANLVAWPWNLAASLGLSGLGVALSLGVTPSFCEALVYAAAAAAGLPTRTARLLVWAVPVALLCLLFAAGRLPPPLFVSMLLLQLVVSAFLVVAERYRSVERRLRAAELARARMEERDRLARDLHDVLGHTLSLLVLKSQLAQRLVREDPDRCLEECRDLEAEARRALEDVRAAVAGFRTLPLPEAIREAERVSLAAGIAFTAEPPPPLAEAESGVLGLVLREAVTNAVRHSHAKHLRVGFTRREGALEMTVADDGQGFDPAGAAGGRAGGLVGMRERLKAVGGGVRVESRPGSGTRVVAWLPAR